LALSASMQPFAGVEKFLICEYPGNPKKLATDITKNLIDKNLDGYVSTPEKPGLGIEINLQALKDYQREVLISIDSEIIYQTKLINN
jgi:L-alanine-DL-glutamate epimerase-like enolase superfamily enzyme